MNTLDLEMKFDAPTEAGELAGYGAIFGNVDQVGDRITPGAFSKSIVTATKRGGGIPMLWQHDPYRPIGIWDELEEDAKGLKVKGRIILETAQGREAHALAKAGVIGALSIGYRTVKDAIEGGVRILKELDVWEISLVTFPANQKAKLTAVKGVEGWSDFARRLRDGEPPEIKEFEDLLREAGVPKALATRIASAGYAKAIRSESEGKASETVLSTLRDAARTLTTRT